MELRLAMPCWDFWDLSKAFDCVDHNIPLKKLFDIGIQGVSYDWIQSLLLNKESNSLVFFIESAI